MVETGGCCHRFAYFSLQGLPERRVARPDAEAAQVEAEEDEDERWDDDSPDGEPRAEKRRMRGVLIKPVPPGGEGTANASSYLRAENQNRDAVFAACMAANHDLGYQVLRPVSDSKRLQARCVNKDACEVSNAGRSLDMRLAYHVSAVYNVGKKAGQWHVEVHILSPPHV